MSVRTREATPSDEQDNPQIPIAGAIMGLFASAFKPAYNSTSSGVLYSFLSFAATSGLD